MTDPKGCLDVLMTPPETEGDRGVMMLTDSTFETLSSFQHHTQYLQIHFTCCQHTGVISEKTGTQRSSFISCPCHEALNNIMTYCSECRRLLSLGFVGLCMGGLLFPSASALCRSLSTVPALLGSAHCCVASGVKQQAHQSHPESRPGTVRKGCCVIGLAFERCVA